MKKLQKIFAFFTGIILLIACSYILFCSIFKIHKVSENLKPIILIIGTIVGIGFLVKLYKVIEKKQISPKKINIIVFILCIFFFTGLIFVRN